ncbi:MAG: Uma2 family endonuclease [Deltaproteobacteria bacterium]|nr:Uma2 family endonuclease [Deltaproteobacteria bacterium]
MVANRIEEAPRKPSPPLAALAPVERPAEDVELPLVRRMKRAEYHALIDAGALEDEKVELLFGALSPMNPQKRPHSKTASAFMFALYDKLGERAAIQAHSPIVAVEDSEPEPDVAVFDPAENDSDDHPKTVWLVVEIADSSRKKDLELKARLYALSGIPEYWVVDLPKRVVHVMRRPDGDEYVSRTTYAFHQGHVLSPERFPDVRLELDRLVPEPPPATATEPTVPGEETP